MKSRLTRWWTRRPRLGWGAKAARNIVLAALIAGAWWLWLGCPLPTAELEFRRLERRHLCPPSELVFVLQKEEVEARDGTWLWIPGAAVAVGVTDDRAVVGCSVRQSKTMWDSLDQYPLGEGPSLIPLGHRSIWWNRIAYGESSIMICSGLLVLNLPGETARGELEVDITYREKDYHRSCPLWQLEDGNWLAGVETPDDGYTDDWYAGGAYTLRLYREDGSLLLEQPGIIPGALA